MMTTQDAIDTGERIAQLIRARNPDAAYSLLAPILSGPLPFRLLDRIGAPVGLEALPQVNSFLDTIASHQTEGGWVVIASALRQQLDRDREGSFERCRRYVMDAAIWYATDILGERVPGPALVDDFKPVLKLLRPWRDDENAWVRRTAGVAAHFWAKRSRGDAEHLREARALLEFLAPVFEERDMNAVKGFGWALKTLGRNYPDLLTEWLVEEAPRRPRHRALMLRKALKFLPEAHRERVRAKVG
jgi:3-methyladenine DNA glycosylase AlkD